MPRFETNTNRVCTRTVESKPWHNPVEPLPGEGFRRWDGESGDAYGAEQCTSTAFELPWHATGTADAASRVVGGLPGWRAASARRPGRLGRILRSARFPLAPANEAQAALLFREAGLEPEEVERTGWTGLCSPVFGASLCGSENGDRVCPPGLVCVQGMCLTSMHAAKGRQACYRSEACSAGEVCNGEGRCSLFQFHIWNLKDTAVEVTRLSPECGFGDASREQTFRNASAWQAVPDLLHHHGFCSHARFYEYRKVMESWKRADWNKVVGCESSAASADVKCDGGTTKWPWILDKLDPLKRTTERLIGNEARGSLAQDRVLEVRAHSCDMQWFHLEPMRVCSGGTGEKLSGWLTYQLTDRLLNAQAATLPADWLESLTQGYHQPLAEDVAYWMRTVDPASGKLAFAKLGDSTLYQQFSTNSKLAFIGVRDIPVGLLSSMFKDVQSSSEGGLQPGKIFPEDVPQLLRCSRLSMCTLPTFTYNGLAVDRHVVKGDVQLSIEPYTLNDARTCGMAGYVKPGGSKCVLDRGTAALLALALQPGSKCADLFDVPSDNWHPDPTTLEYAAEKQEAVKELLQDLVRGVHLRRAEGESLVHLYERAMHCAAELADSQKELAERASGLYQSTYSEELADEQAEEIADEEVASSPYAAVRHGAGLYFVFEYGAYEFPVLWWVKYMILQAIPGAPLSQRAFESRVDLPVGTDGGTDAWADRAGHESMTDAQTNGFTARELLARFNGRPELFVRNLTAYFGASGTVEHVSDNLISLLAEAVVDDLSVQQGGELDLPRRGEWHPQCLQNLEWNDCDRVELTEEERLACKRKIMLHLTTGDKVDANDERNVQTSRDRWQGAESAHPLRFFGNPARFHGPYAEGSPQAGELYAFLQQKTAQDIKAGGRIVSELDFISSEVRYRTPLVPDSGILRPLLRTRGRIPLLAIHEHPYDLSIAEHEVLVNPVSTAREVALANPGAQKCLFAKHEAMTEKDAFGWHSNDRPVAYFQDTRCQSDSPEQCRGAAGVRHDMCARTPASKAPLSFVEWAKETETSKGQQGMGCSVDDGGSYDTCECADTRPYYTSRRGSALFWRVGARTLWTGLGNDLCSNPQLACKEAEAGSEANARHPVSDYSEPGGVCHRVDSPCLGGEYGWDYLEFEGGGVGDVFPTRSAAGVQCSLRTLIVPPGVAARLFALKDTAQLNLAAAYDRVDLRSKSLRSQALRQEGLPELVGHGDDPRSRHWSVAPQWLNCPNPATQMTTTYAMRVGADAPLNAAEAQYEVLNTPQSNPRLRGPYYMRQGFTEFVNKENQMRPTIAIDSDQGLSAQFEQLSANLQERPFLQWAVAHYTALYDSVSDATLAQKDGMCHPDTPVADYQQTCFSMYQSVTHRPGGYTAAQTSLATTHEPGMWVFDAAEESMWRAADPGEGLGACSYALQLARGFFCSEGQFPLDVCQQRWGYNADVRAIPVRGNVLLGERSMYRCTPCVRVPHGQATFSTLAACGYYLPAGYRITDEYHADSGLSEKGEGARTSDFPKLLAMWNRALRARMSVRALRDTIRADALRSDGDDAGGSFGKRFRGELARLVMDAAMQDNGGGASEEVEYTREADAARAIAVLRTGLEDLPPSITGAFDLYGVSAGVSELRRTAHQVCFADGPDTEECPFQGYNAENTKLRSDTKASQLSLSTDGCTEGANSVPRSTDFDTCNVATDLRRIQLRSYLANAYEREYGAWLPVVQPKSAITFAGRLEGFQDKFTFMYSKRERGARRRFASWVLSENRCKGQSQTNMMCIAGRGETKGAMVLNPWVGGGFTVFDDDFDEATGTAPRPWRSLDVCAAPGGFGSAFCSRCLEDNPYCDTDYYTELAPDEPSRDALRRRDLQSPLYFSVVPGSKEDLCSKRPVEAQTCTHDQDMLGGTLSERGQSRPEFPSMRELDSLSRSIPLEDKHFTVQSIFDVDNALWSGRSLGESEAAQNVDLRYGFLQLDPASVLPSHIILTISPEKDMRVDRLQFIESNQGQADGDVTLTPVSDWQREKRRMQEQDRAEIKRLYPQFRDGSAPTPRSLRWDCGFRAVSFLNARAASPTFRPLVPDPVRTARAYALTRGVNETAGVHPLVRAYPLSDAARFVTTNGRCFYQLQAMSDASSWLSSDSRSTDDPCAPRELLRSLMDGRFRETRVQTGPGASCPNLVDWPDDPSTLRTGERWAGNPQRAEQRGCGMLGRLQPFLVRTFNEAAITEPLDPLRQTTFDKGGDCHLGRVAQATSAQVRDMDSFGRCVAEANSASNITVRCYGTEGNPLDSQEFVLPRRRLANVTSSLFETKRMPRRCSRCSQPPAYYTHLGADATDRMPIGEVSYGRIHRVSVERSLAADLLLSVAPGDVNRENWRAGGKFWERYFANPAALVAGGGAPPQPAPPSLRQVVDERPAPVSATPVWESQWVISAPGGAQGSIPESTWRAGVGQRAAACSAAAQEHLLASSMDDLAKGISICSVSGALSRFCEHMTAALQHIRFANCIAAGDCYFTSTFYSPTQYSLTNDNFVAETMREFYLATNETACAADGARGDDADARITSLQQGCFGNSLEAVKRMIELFRELAQNIVLIIYDLFMIAMNLPLLATASITEALGVPTQSLIDEILFYFYDLMQRAAESIKQAMMLVVRMLMNTPFMSWLEGLLKIICVIINALVWLTNQALCLLGPAINWVLNAFLDVVRFFAESEINIVGIGQLWDIITKAIKPVYQTLAPPISKIVSWIEENKCNLKGPENCQFTVQETTQGTTQSLSSRCWIDIGLDNPFRQGVQVDALGGASSVLGCRAGDTCQLSPLGDMGLGSDNLVKCDDCPIQEHVTAFKRYGCDMLTKRCQCGVPILDTKLCTTSRVCLESESSCDIVSDPLSPSYGTLECKFCSSLPMCMLDVADAGFGRSFGRCACTTFSPEMQRCPFYDVGRDISVPTSSGFCFTAGDSASAALLTRQSQSTQGAVPYSSLAVVPCAVLRWNRVHCSPVRSPGGDVDYFIVGAEMLAQYSSDRVFQGESTLPSQSHPIPHTLRPNSCRAKATRSHTRCARTAAEPQPPDPTHVAP